jgi:phosphotransferase system IIA component
VSVVEGVGAKLVYDEVAETVQLSLVDIQGTGLDVSSTQDVVFAVGAVARYVILDPTDGPVGTPITVTVQAQDQWGNVATGENRDVTLVTSGSATGGGLVNIQNGVGTRSINDAVPETVTLSLSDTQGTGLDVSSIQDVVFGAGAATRFVIDDPADGTVDAPITVTVRALDGFGNLATGENRGVTLVASGSAIGGFVNITSGMGSVNVTDQVAQTVTLSLSDTQGTGLDVSSTQTVVFAAGAAIGNTIPVTVEAQDQYGNRAPAENRDVTLVTTGSATGGGLVNITAGVGTRNITNTVAQTVGLSLSDTQGTGLNVSSTQDVVFAPAAATRFVILNPLDGPVGTPIPVTVQAQDVYGNVATGENRDVTLVTTGSATGGGSVDIVSGVGSIAINDTVAETVTLTLSDTQGTGLNVSSTQDVVFTAP